MMIDVDKFKSVNDSYGHAAEDAVLKTLGREISNQLRSYDSLGRYGGEEFLVVAPGCDVGACSQLAERVRDHVAKHSTPIRGCSTISVTISVGVAASSESLFSSEPLVQRADAALYLAKGHAEIESNPSRQQHRFLEGPWQPSRDSSFNLPKVAPEPSPAHQP